MKQLISVDQVPDDLSPEELDALGDQLYDTLVGLGVPSAEQQAVDRKALADQVRMIKHAKE